MDNHLGPTEPMDYIFSHFVGIFAASTLWFIVYCGYMRGSPKINPRLTLGAEFGWLCVRRAEAALDLRMDVDLELLAQISNSISFGKEKTLGNYSYPFVIPAGFVTIPAVLQIELKAAGCGVNPGELEVNAEVVAVDRVTARVAQGPFLPRVPGGTDQREDGRVHCAGGKVAPSRSDRSWRGAKCLRRRRLGGVDGAMLHGDSG